MAAFSVFFYFKVLLSVKIRSRNDVCAQDKFRWALLNEWKFYEISQMVLGLFQIIQ